MYQIKRLNGEIIEFDTLDEVIDWVIVKNDLEFEPNADLWGIDETIKDSGRVCLYDWNSEDGDEIQAELTFKE